MPEESKKKGFASVEVSRHGHGDVEQKQVENGSV